MMDIVFPVPADWAENARIDAAAYDRLYSEALSDPDDERAQGILGDLVDYATEIAPDRD